MSKTRKWHVRAIHLAVALAMTLGLLMVPAAVAAPDSEPAASPDATTFRFYDQNSAPQLGTVCWSQTQVHDDLWSVWLDRDATGDGFFHLEFTPDPGITVSDFQAAITDGTPKWSYWYWLQNTGVVNGAQFELYFTHCGYDPASDDGWLEITAVNQTITGAGAWLEETLAGATVAGYGGQNLDGTGFFEWTPPLTPLSGILAAINTDAAQDVDDWELTRVRIQLWESVDHNCYIDDITIDGTTYEVEPGPDEYYLEPDIAYNVKTATERFTVIGPCGPVLHADVAYWDVETACSAGIGTAKILPGTGGDGQNYADVRMMVKGDAHVSAWVDTDGGGEIEFDTEVIAEKKWGDIHCTELTKGTLVDDECCVTETVLASFFWEGCEEEEILLADDAVVDWWLMDIDALAAVEALEAELGADPAPCEEPDGGCGTYTPDFFSYDVDGDGTIQADEVFDSPYDAMAAIYDLLANKVVNTESYINFSTQTHLVTSTDVDGETAVMVHIESPTGVILATLTDYPEDKHGQNTVCVQHETWVVIPPPTAEKFPLIAWVGEKTVVEWNLGATYIGLSVKFASEIPYSVGVLEDPLTGDLDTAISTKVMSDGIARCIVHSDKSGKTNILAALTEEEPTGQSGPNQIIDGIIEQAFIVYWLAFHSVELRNIDSAAIPNPDWDTAGDIVSDMEVGASDYLRVRVKGYFIDPDPEYQSPRLETWLDTDGDETPDLYLQRGWWLLPDDWNALAGGALWRLQKPHWDLMDELDDLVRSDLDTTVGPAFGDRVEEMGDYDNAWEVINSVNSPSGIADYPVIGPFSTAQPWDPDQWVTTPCAVASDGQFKCGTADLRTTVVPNYECNEFDAIMPPAMVYIVADSGTLSTEDKGDIYYGVHSGKRYYTFPYYREEIPASPLLNPYYGEGPAGYRWDSWDNDPANAPLGVKGPYDFYEGLNLWPYDYDVINDTFGYSIVAADEQLLAVYTDNHGEAWAEFTMTEIGITTIKAIATYPMFVGDFNPVISNDVTKTSVDLKDIVLYVDDVDPVDPIRKVLYVFVRNYDGTPASCEKVEWLIDGPWGVLESLLEGTDEACTNACYPVDYYDCEDADIAGDGRSADSCTREWLDDAERDEFVDEAVFASAAVADDYAIAGVTVLSSHLEDVDISIKIHDCWDGAVIIMTEDKMVEFTENNPAVEVGLDSIMEPVNYVVMVYNYKAGEGVEGWTMFNPAWADTHPTWNTLTTLYKNRGYWLNVNAACTLTYETQTYELDEGWNNIGWGGA